jgi:glycosyltransferase involved in cell wall biosynthesis
MLRHSYSVTCKGDRDIEYLVKQGIKKEKLYVYNGGIDIKRFCQAETQKSIDIIYAGRFNNKKGSFRLLDVIIKLLAERPALKCVFLGEGELRAGFEEKVSVLGLKNNIKCYGHIADPEVYYRQSRLFVLPSSNEGLSTAMLEAMSCGCVPVVSNVGNTSEAVKDNYNGCLIDNFEDIESFASAIATILGNVERQTEFSRNAIETVQNQYSFSVQSKFFERIIR